MNITAVLHNFTVITLDIFSCPFTCCFVYDCGFLKQHEKSENKNASKRIKLAAEETERFGTAFGVAWKAAY